MATTRADRRAAIESDIKGAALRQLAALGAAQISLRGIAAELGITAPAIYRYFPSRDALLTALIADGYRSLGAALRQAQEAVPAEDVAGRIVATVVAYRVWALDHGHEFALLFGTPVPGYRAPREETVPAVTEVFEALLQPIVAGWEQHPRSPAPSLPSAGLAPGAAANAQPELPAALMPVVIRMLGQIHGLTMLELTGHLQPIVGDPEPIYRNAAEEFIRELGLAPPP